jgi:hypothetical protein
MVIPEARKTFEAALDALKAENPGFSGESYGLALHTACVRLR